ncbi:AAA family ATPase [Sphingomonas sp. BAUL-RG-20F-R05-02]|uniref:nucleotide-binding protein n=1 Tax=Sphingomonas sp. BAUL-RG-20F-R05-02 TaxID=2914830 RepID=UPI0028C4B04E|nr:AAA family ATPase [Sphingomonas sp. BAUL-RG-20F-R05-02]
MPACQHNGKILCCVASSKSYCIAVMPACRYASNMRTIAIVSQKGGAGKTTLALHIATAAEASGLPSVIIDLDPQASAAGWGDSRQGEAPVVVALPYSRLSHGLTAASAGGAKLVVIDTAPHSDSVAIAAIKAADLVLIPCRAGILDLRAISTTAELVASAKKRAFVLLNAVPPRATQLLADAQAAVAQHGLEVAPVGLQQRAAFGHALTAGQTAPEYEPNGKAAEEVDHMLQWLRAILQI